MAALRATLIWISTGGRQRLLRKSDRLFLHPINQTVGALRSCASEADAFGDGELALLREGAVDVSYAIASQRTKAEFERAWRNCSAGSGGESVGRT